MNTPHASIGTEPAALISPFDDPECAYLAMPDGMRTFSLPRIDNWPDQNAAAGRAMLESIAQQLTTTEPHGIYAIQSLNPDSRRFIGEVLGRGEISIRIMSPSQQIEIEESVFAGLWRAKSVAVGQSPQEYLEIGPLPQALNTWAQTLTAGYTLTPPDSFPDGIMNAPALLAEIADKAQNHQAGRDSIINLSLLPMTPQDVALIADMLGLSGLSVVSKGYGDCRIHLTRLAHVWWVQYFNSPGQLILNTLEITAIPSVIAAAPEDLSDSAQRLLETLRGLD